MIRIAAYVLILGAMLGGCASVPMAPPSADAAAKTFAVDAHKANLYIYRNETFGAAMKLPVLVDHVDAGDTASKTYIFKQVEPGSHVITSKSENDSTLNIEARAGETYFVWLEVKMGLWAAGSQLHLVDEATGRAGVNECKLIQ
jgi:hypothetical protein